MKAILMAIALLVIGFVLLIKGADYFVDGSSAVAKKLKVPSLIIGFTIVAMGTSLPECAVSVAASVTNNNALAVSNAVGSNIFNLMVVCGICALIVPLTVQIETLKKRVSVFCFLCIVIACPWLLGNESWSYGGNYPDRDFCMLSFVDDFFGIKGETRSWGRGD